MAIPVTRRLAIAASIFLAGCASSSTRPSVPDPGPPEGRQVGPANWLVQGGALAWSAVTNEILASGRVQAVPPGDADALHAINAVTGAYRVVDGAALRLTVSESGDDVFLATANAYPDPPGYLVVRRSLLDGSRQVWPDGVRGVLSPGDSLLAVMTSPWYLGSPTLTVVRLADDAVVAAPDVAIPLTFSPDGARLLVRDNSPASPNHRVIAIADLSVTPLPLGLPQGDLVLEPLRWDERGVRIVHADFPDRLVISVRSMADGTDMMIVQTTGGLAGLSPAWSNDGRYAAVFTHEPFPVAGLEFPAREVSVWVLDTITDEKRVIATTYDTMPGRYPQEYAGVFSPDGTSFAWEAGGTLFVVPLAAAPAF